ncbi:cyclic pyranopterin monophosphate synthase accessory protein [Salinivibrio sp. MA427]|uniref:Cyclic pyranopterin monophosphate synthase n=1 Tax=Salinivibrio costicola subsp. alcaliphilus TaxID=272773 RepID=A0ABX3KQL7_SALCS|nr:MULTISPECIES: cyclic pyranopterin monophosphate synthase MoaC [Salinivibrio]ODP96336.1 molybdenum cofactor biosynthesis protein C [Salinivibrio sp. BNH]OOF01556.1 cyclic pyranopterin monophosphate synthase accessory protein [Salinivibrio sp. MA440]OOF04886.1 cyclic pyranopterin monophosphate synthase accessory protein [Salinivibrio sp. MA427]OOF33850.1 cyclic pyranopterin monophosphate synthase accessory protein [Salinivibrio costicola subsp. alcaliphilus]
MCEFSHINATGQANMVDVSNKGITRREAVAIGTLKMSPSTVNSIKENQIKKGDVLSTARIAGIQAAKKCSDLIPLCHQLNLSKIWIDFELLPNGIQITCGCILDGKTGVEMEALTGVSVAALTLFDMCKAADKNMIIEGVHVRHKSGGQSGSIDRGMGYD